MKILIISDQYYPLGGGIEQYLRGLSKELTKQGHKIVIISRTIEGAPEDVAMPEGRVIRTHLLLSAIRDPQVVLRRWRDLVPLIERVAPDVVYANHHTSLAAITAAQHLNLPVVYGCHGWGLLCPMKRRLLKPDGTLCYNERGFANCVECTKMTLTNSGARRKWFAGIGTELWHSGRRIKHYMSTIVNVAQYNRFQDILNSADARIVPAKRWKEFFARHGTFSIPHGLDLEVYRPVSARRFREKYGI